MKIIIKEVGIPVGGYPHCFMLDSSEMFMDSVRRISQKNVFVLSCDSCPDAVYPSTVSFDYGIHTQLMYFLKKFGPSVIHYGDKEFFIDIREKDSCFVDREFNTFREAFFYCLSEDVDFWDSSTLLKADRLADLH